MDKEKLEKQNFCLKAILFYVSVIAIVVIILLSIVDYEYMKLKEKTEGLINQLCVSYEIKVQECSELQEENENLKTYISTLERYSEN